jgi:hypothetical protein
LKSISRFHSSTNKATLTLARINHTELSLDHLLIHLNRGYLEISLFVNNIDAQPIDNILEEVLLLTEVRLLRIIPPYDYGQAHYNTIEFLGYIYLCAQRSHLLEGDGIDGLDDVFPGLDLLEDVVSVDLIILNDTADFEHIHAVGHWQNLNVLVPDQPE